MSVINETGGESTTNLAKLGFVNVPKGKWVFKTGTFPGFGDNVIPIAVSVSGYAEGSYTENTQASFSGSASATLNGIGVAGMSWYKRGGVGDSTTHSSVSANYIFAPAVYGMDLTAVQAGITSGSVSVWLEKED